MKGLEDHRRTKLQSKEASTSAHNAQLVTMLEASTSKMKNTVKERNSQLQQLEEQTAMINDGQVPFDSMTARA